MTYASQHFFCHVGTDHCSLGTSKVYGDALGPPYGNKVLCYQSGLWKYFGLNYSLIHKYKDVTSGVQGESVLSFTKNDIS